MEHDATDQPAVKHPVNPPPRRRVGAGEPATPGSNPTPEAAAGGTGHRPPPPPDFAAAAPDDDPPRPHKVGYKNPPLETRFKKNNPGGPGRPKEKKSQDTLMREALLTKRTVRIGNRDRQVTNLQLLNTLAVDVPVKNREHRPIMAVLNEARRLFAEPAPIAQAPKAHDPGEDRAILQQVRRFFMMGEANPDSGNPLRDVLIGSPDLGERATDEGWDEGEWDTSSGEASNDEA